MNKRWLAFALLLSTCLMAKSVAMQPADLPAAGLGAQLTQGYIAPAMSDFRTAATKVHRAIQEVCQPKAHGSTHDVEQAFRQLVLAWSGIEFLRFGPLVDANRFERIYFWPDPRGITARQVQALLAQPAAEIPDALALAKQSVAVQGLPALEYTLYRESGLLSADAGPGRESTCVFANAVAGNIEHIADELAAQWKVGGPYAQLFSSPAPDNPLYRDTQEVAAEMIKALSTGLQFQRDVKLAPALAQGPDHSKARRAPFWRSNQTVVSLEGAVGGMLAFYRAADLPFGDSAWIDENVQGELQRTLEHLSALSAPTEQLFTDESGHRQLVLVKLLVGNVKDLVDQDVAPALGVRIGFNALDGD